MSYVKTVWSENDPITVSKIQKIEDRAYEITQKYKNVFNIDNGETVIVGYIIDMIDMGIPVIIQYNKHKYYIGTYAIHDEVYYDIPALYLYNVSLSDNISLSFFYNHGNGQPG